jgi:hemolysin III
MTNLISETISCKQPTMRPLVRGYIHQAAFFIAICACAVLVIHHQGSRSLLASLIYSVSLIGMYGISALYHIPTWSPKYYKIMRRIDHAAIFALIAGSATPICLLTLPSTAGWRLLAIFWVVAFTGMFMATVWTHGPKWIRALFYVAMGWIGVLYFPELKSALNAQNFHLLVAGGIIYTVGALIYAFKKPNPFPRVFGYHEIFHVFVVVASACHFCLNYNLIT